MRGGGRSEGGRGFFGGLQSFAGIPGPGKKPMGMNVVALGGQQGGDRIGDRFRDALQGRLAERFELVKGLPPIDQVGADPPAEAKNVGLFKMCRQPETKPQTVV